MEVRGAFGNGGGGGGGRQAGSHVCICKIHIKHIRDQRLLRVLL